MPRISVHRQEAGPPQPRAHRTPVAPQRPGDSDWWGADVVVIPRVRAVTGAEGIRTCPRVGYTSRDRERGVAELLALERGSRDPASFWSGRGIRLP